MEKIGARQTVALLRHVECALAYLQTEPAISILWGIPQFLTSEAETILEEADEAYWQDPDQLLLLGYRHYLSASV